MYKIIGADQQEYGPVTADQVREWIDEGRANGATLIQFEGREDWVPLSSLPEFAEALAARAPVSPAPTPSAPMDPDALAQYVRTRDYSIDIGLCLSRSWNLFKENFGLFIGAALILLALIFGFNQLVGLFTRGSMESLMTGNVTVEAIIVLLLWNIPEVAFSTILTVGMYVILLKRMRGRPAGIGEIFAGFSVAPGQLALAGIVIQFLTILGVLACIAPGIYLSIAWILTMPLIIDRGLTFWPAMELSRKVVTQQWWIMFCLVIVVALISLVGLLACCVGLLVALPVGLGALLYAYEDIFGSTGPAAR